VTIIILACFSKALDKEGKYGQLDAVWRIQMGLALIPAFATLWPRLTMPEGKKYLESQELNAPSSSSSSVRPIAVVPAAAKDPAKDLEVELPVTPSHSSIDATVEQTKVGSPPDSSSPVILDDLGDLASRKVRLSTFFVYFSEWRHLKTLLGTTSCWFLLDIAFYGTNLNQSVLLTDIGFSTGANEYDILMRNAVGNLIIAVSGYVPGYFFTIYFIEKLGRRWIQIQGFLVVALMFAILAGGYNHLGTAGKFVCFAIAQVRNITRFHSCFVLLSNTDDLSSASSSSISAQIPPRSSYRPKFSLPACAGLLTVSVRPLANWVPYFRRCCSII
jgi:MFS transporter, PHS family, inorganic phosphate transporter